MSTLFPLLSATIHIRRNLFLLVLLLLLLLLLRLLLSLLMEMMLGLETESRRGSRCICVPIRGGLILEIGHF